MRGAATDPQSSAVLTWNRLYKDARRAGLQEWHSREYADRIIAGELELRAELRRLVSLDCPTRLIAAILL